MAPKKPNSKGTPLGQSQEKRDPKFSLVVKNLFKLIQVLHHLAICRGQLNGQLTKGFMAKLEDLTRFPRPACPTDKLAAEFKIVGVEWVKGVTGVLITHYTSQIAELSRLILASTLAKADFVRAQHLAESWARKRFRSKLSDKTLSEFHGICQDFNGAPAKYSDAVRSCPRSDQGGVKATTSGLGTPVSSKRKVSNSPTGSPNSQVSPPQKRAKCVSPGGSVLPPRRPSVSKTQSRVGSSPKANFQPWRPDKGTSKTYWSLPKLSAPTLIVGDSNLSNISKSRVSKKDLEVCSFPGAKFYNLRGLFSKTKPQTHVKNLILSVGVNERGNNASTTCLPQFKKMLAEARQLFPEAKISLASLQWDSKRISNAESATLKTLQKGIEDLKTIPLIPTLSESKFKIAPEDKYGIHWTKETANCMLDHWLDFLN